MKAEDGHYRKRRLSLEYLEPRILLGAVNPGEPALLASGDTLYFVQGETPEGEDTAPSDAGGEPDENWVIIADYTGSGSVQFEDAFGRNSMQNGGKIGDVTFFNTAEDSRLFIRTGRFLEGHGLDDLPGTLQDIPDTVGDAWEIPVPSGQSGGAATYSTGRAIVAASGTQTPDWYRFPAQEAEQIQVFSTLSLSTDIYVQYGAGSITWKGVDSYTIGDENPGGPDGVLDDVTVYLSVAHLETASYTLVVDRVEINDPLLGNTTVGEDFPQSADTAIDLTYNEDTQTGFGPLTPEFTFSGEALAGSVRDYFTFTLHENETIHAANFSNVRFLRLSDSEGGFLASLGDGGQYTYTPGEGEPEEQIITMDVRALAAGAWEVDLNIEPILLSQIVELVTDDDGNYIWGNAATTPWMNSYTEGGERVDVAAPEGSGGAVVTGNVVFDGSCTGFGTFALDGSLKGAISGLATDQTIHQIMVGYINSQQSDFQGTTVGGLNIGGNVDRLLVRTTVAEMEGADRPGDPDRWAPADISVGGYLMDFQASGTIFADVTVGGNTSFAGTYVYGFDNDLDPVTLERILPEGTAGIISDDPNGAYVVGSPSGDFIVTGEVSRPLGPERQDPQDWYVFNAGLGQEITVEMLQGDVFLWPAFVISPSGRVVSVVEFDEPDTFIADEGGNYYLLVGEPPPEQMSRFVSPAVPWGTLYEVQISGTRPVHLGGLVAGSNIIGQAADFPDFQLGDDISWTTVGGLNLGFIDVRDGGSYGWVELDVQGDLGYVTSPSVNTAGLAGFLPLFIQGNLDKIETRDGDLNFSDLTVGGNLGELYTPGLLSNVGFLNSIAVFGSVGSLVVGGDFYSQMSVSGEGMDLFYVGGDFGSLIRWSRLDTAFGGDVGFAHVAGTIYDEHTLVYPVSVIGQTARFVDDGGSEILLSPVSTQWTLFDPNPDDNIPGRWVRVPATLTYRYLPIGHVGGGQGSAVITEVTANDALVITVLSGQADLSYIEFGAGVQSFLEVRGRDMFAELDLYHVQTDGAGFIANYSHQGDIVNVNAGSLRRIFAAGHIGLTERFLSEGGRLPNPTPADFSPPTVDFVSERDAAYFNGVVVTSDVWRIVANGSIGDVYVTGNIDLARANADRAQNGTGFIFRGVGRDERTWDGIAGVVYAAGDIRFIDPGDGLYGGRGEVPVGGIFAQGIINQVWAAGPLGGNPVAVSGPVFGLGGIRQFTGFRTVISEGIIGAGADFSDSMFWDEFRLTTTGVRLGAIVLNGADSGIDSSVIQAGVLGRLFIGPGTEGMVDSQIWVIGDPQTEEGINSITILGGSLDGSGAPPFGGLGRHTIETNQRIGPITVAGRGVDMIDTDVHAFKSIQSITVQSDIIFNRVVDIIAPLFINRISADDITGTGFLWIGTGELRQLVARGDFEADVTVNGPTRLFRVGGTFEAGASLTTAGPQGRIEQLIVGQGLAGDVTAANYIGALNVLNGDATGDIWAGGSNQNNLAIGRIAVWHGNLGNVATYADPEAVRPGGGIGSIFVGGGVFGDITATSAYNSATGHAVTAHIGVIRVVGDDIWGDITIQRNDPGDARDPGGNLGSLLLFGHNLYGEVNIEGNVGQLIVGGGSITEAVQVLGSPVYAGNLDLFRVVGGPSNGDLTVAGTLGTFSMGLNTAMNGQVSAGALTRAFFSTTVSNTVTVTGRIGLLVARNGIGATVTAGGGLGVLRSFGDVAADVDITGNAGTIDIYGHDLAGALTVSAGNVQTLRILNAQLTATGIVDVDGAVGFLQILNPGNVAVEGSINVSDRIGQAILTGDVGGPVTIGDNEIGDGVGLFVLRGDLDGELTVNGDVNQMSIIGGQVSSNGDPADERIEIAGDADALRVLGTAGGTVIDDDVYVGNRLGFFLVRGGSFEGGLTAGSMGQVLYFTPDGLTQDVRSLGDLDLLQVSSGPIAASVDVFHHAGTILAQRGIAATGIVTVGAGASGSGLDSLIVGTGDFLGDVAVNGNLSRVLVRGNFTDGSIDASTLGRVTVNGAVSGQGEVPPGSGIWPDRIHAATGSFDLFASGTFYDIDGSSQILNGVLVSVG